MSVFPARRSVNQRDVGPSISMFPIEPPNELGVNIRRCMRYRWLIQFGLAGIIAVFFCSCEEIPQVQKPLAAVMPTPTPIPGWWNDEGVSGSPRIIVHIGEQTAYFYKGKRLVGQSTVSTGKPGFSTPPGHYNVLQKDNNHVSSEFGDYVDDEGSVVKSNIDVRNDSQPRGTHFDGARVPYFMRFRGGYGMHAGYVPPHRATHGCIRLPKLWADPFYENDEEG